MTDSKLKMLLLDDLAGIEVAGKLEPALENGFGAALTMEGLDTPWREWVFRAPFGNVHIRLDMVDKPDRARDFLADHDRLDPYDLVLVDNDWEARGAHHEEGLKMLAGRDTTRDFGPLVAIYTGASSFKPGYVFQALEVGAKALVQKSEPTHLLNVILAAMERAKLRALDKQIEALSGEFQQDSTLAGAVSTAMRDCMRRAALYAPRNSHVLLVGERGTGKTTLAEQIHLHSPRAAGPYRRLDLSQISRELIESTLFGHVKGSFTGADRDRAGLVEEMAGGTVFLDDFQNVPKPVQDRFRRAFEDSAYARVGEVKERRADVRYIVALNQDPTELVASGQLQQDIVDRIKALTLRIPPLRERPEDIPLLAERLLAAAWRSEYPDATPPKLGEDALTALQAQTWPDNVRGLKIVMQRVAIHTPFHVRTITRAELEKGEDLSLGLPFSPNEFHSLKQLDIRNGTQRQLLHLLIEAGGQIVPLAQVNAAAGAGSDPTLPAGRIQTAITRLRDRLRTAGLDIEHSSANGTKGYRLVRS